MKTPWFDREKNVWVDKDEYDGNKKESTEEIDAEITAAKEATVDRSFAESLMVNEDDMPF